MYPTHFTAWVVNDSSRLDQDNCDVTVLEDVLIGGDPEYDESWATDSAKSSAFYAVTSVDAKNGDMVDAQADAEELLKAAGWRLVGTWKAVDVAYIATVERACAHCYAQQGHHVQCPNF